MSTTDQDSFDRLARAVCLARRGARYVVGALVVFALGIALTTFMTTKVRRVFLSECTFVVHAAERPGQEDRAESIRRRNARLKDMAHERARLEEAIRKFNLYPDVAESSGMLDAVEAMKPHVGIRARESGRYVVSFEMAERPGIDARNMVRDVTQYLAESMAEDYVGGSIGELRSDAEFLSKEVTAASGEIDAAVKGVSKFLALHPEFVVDVPAGSSFGFAKVGKKPAEVEAAQSGDPVLAALFRQKARLEGDLRVSLTPIAPVDLPRDRAAAALEAAIKAYAVAQADVLTKGAKLTPEHPDMKVALALAAVAAKQVQEARSTLAVLDAAASPPSQSAAAKLKEIETQIAARQTELATKPAGGIAAVNTAPVEVSNAPIDLETEWQRVLRELGEAKKRYDELKGKSDTLLLTLKTSEVHKANLVAIIEPAYRPSKPTSGRRLLTVLLGLASSCAFAVLFVIGRVLLDDTLTDVGDIEAVALTPALGTLANVATNRVFVPLARRRPPATSTALALRRISVAPGDEWPIHATAVVASPTAPPILAVIADEPGPVAALRLVRHRLELLHADGMRVFAVTSPREREGKSTFAAQLALILSEAQRARVVLVEACFRRPPALARTLGFDVPIGASLSGQVIRAMQDRHEDWTVVSLGSALHVLAESEDEPRLPRALHSAYFRDLLGMLGKIYDYVIVDAPSVLDGGEANTLEPIVDGIILVTHAGVSKKSELRRALRQLGARKTIGTLLVSEATKDD